jgi:hypothetical protein
MVAEWATTKTVLFVLFLAFYVAAFSLYQFMVFAVNRQLPTDSSLPNRGFPTPCFGADGIASRTHIMGCTREASSTSYL